MGWFLCKKHPDVKEKGKTVDMLDLWADRIVRFQRRFYIPLIIALRGTIFMGIPMYLTG
jgi:stearoyl-CoA desaturase (delta-9 desaturase)